MTVKLVLIAAVAAAFGWGFSALVENADRVDRSDAHMACQDISGTDCAQTFER